MPPKALQGPKTMSVCVWRGQQEQQAVHCPLLGAGQRAPGPRLLRHAQGLQGWRSPCLDTHPSQVRVGGPLLALIQQRGWLTATMAEQGLFIDIGAQPPPVSEPAHPSDPGPEAPDASPVCGLRSVHN